MENLLSSEEQLEERGLNSENGLHRWSLNSKNGATGSEDI